MIGEDSVADARSMGGPIYIVEGLVPINSAGLGGKGSVPTRIRIKCGPFGAQVEVGTSIGRSIPRGWSVAHTFSSLTEPYVFPIKFECDVTAIYVAGSVIEFPIITCGTRWAGEVQLRDRWISLSSSDLRPDQFALAELELDDIESLNALFL